MVRQAPVICVMAPPIHLGAWSMALMLWLPFELLLSNSEEVHCKDTMRCSITNSIIYDETNNYLSSQHGCYD